MRKTGFFGSAGALDFCSHSPTPSGQRGTGTWPACRSPMLWCAHSLPLPETCPRQWESYKRFERTWRELGWKELETHHDCPGPGDRTFIFICCE
jgi:hypothetical protein